MTAVFEVRRSAGAARSGPVRAAPGARATRARGAPPAPALHELDCVACRRAFLQPSIQIGRADDALEDEADHVADQILRAPAPGGVLQRTFACGGAPGHDGECESCREKRLGLRRRATAWDASTAPPIVHEVLRSPGRPLEPAVRSFFEPRFGHDFSDVRLHMDGRAAASARAVGAAAYTVGRDIVVASGRFAPAAESGQWLLAHELAHVVQQRSLRAAPSVQRQLFPPIPIVVAPTTESLEVNVVDARQEPDTPWYAPWRYTGPLANFFRGDVTMTDVASMVDHVSAYLRGRTMDRLNVMDHGNEDGVEIGDDWLASPADVQPFAATLGRLRSRFTSGAFVHMQNCNAGKNRSLICALAAAFGVPVLAGTGAHNPLLGFNVGDYVRCEPDGTFNPNAGRPSTPTHPSRRGPLGLRPDDMTA